MTNPLRRRLEKAERAIEGTVTSPEMVRAARGRWEERGELPEEPKLRAIVVRINQALEEMDAVSGVLR